jgi:hypothetical protein
MRLMLVLSFSLFYAQNRPLIRIGKLQYTGGDWYGNRTALSNLLQYAAEHAPMPLALQEEVVSPSDPNLARFTLLYAAGHGYITFSAPKHKTSAPTSSGAASSS